ncbi:protein of unknown function [Xenorhabdus poinarii G6]|uniref:Uncharacterized protein n=1 Tax=Xenorhabdus poinarii G6 TaxID=1354304 RepID=A0A068QYV1_9GAMM|nr:protein of unknown function [Xenorhabdus poinarii G6]
MLLIMLPHFMEIIIYVEIILWVNNYDFNFYLLILIFYCRIPLTIAT